MSGCEPVSRNRFNASEQYFEQIARKEVPYKNYKIAILNLACRPNNAGCYSEPLASISPKFCHPPNFSPLADIRGELLARTIALSCGRQGENKFGTFSEFTFHPHFTAVGLHDVLHDRKPEPRAALFT